MVIKRSEDDDNGYKPQKRCWDPSSFSPGTEIDETVVSNEDDGYFTDIPVMTDPIAVPAITGILRNAVKAYDKRYVGEVHGHRDYPEGHVIRTSEVAKVHVLIETASGSFYLLEERPDDH